MKYLTNIIYALFPMINCNSANKFVTYNLNSTWNKVRNRESIQSVEQFSNIDEENAKSLLNNTRNNITSLQDKAKVTAVAVTLAFSMVGGISSYILNLKDKLYANGWVTAFLVLFVILSCFYLIVSGFYSLLTLNSRPKYDFSTEDYIYLESLSTEEEKRQEKLLMIGTQYTLTSFQNTILNNYVDCSNNNLRNALISLGIFFSLICLSFTISTNTSNQIEEQSKIINIQTELIKELQVEVKKMNESLEITKQNQTDLVELNQNTYNEISSEIEKLYLLLERKLSNDNVQE